MARINANTSAANSTEEKKYLKEETGCPTWDQLGGGREMPPFFRPSEEMKREGFQVTFLSNEPRKETVSAFSDARELWFDVDYQGKVHTWTITQLSLLLELKREAPLGGKCFFIKLVPVDSDFRKKRPAYRGKDRYEVGLIGSAPMSGRAKEREAVPSIPEELVVE